MCTAILKTKPPRKSGCKDLASLWIWCVREDYKWWNGVEWLFHVLLQHVLQHVQLTVLESIYSIWITHSDAMWSRVHDDHYKEINQCSLHSYGTYLHYPPHQSRTKSQWNPIQVWAVNCLIPTCFVRDAYPSCPCPFLPCVTLGILSEWLLMCENTSFSQLSQEV